LKQTQTGKPGLFFERKAVFAGRRIAKPLWSHGIIVVSPPVVKVQEFCSSLRTWTG